ncbi:MAG: hypothetical protein ABI693_14305 [Bryobacteraceae bacterium]
MRLGVLIAALFVGVAAAQEVPTINLGGIVPNKPGAAGPITPGIELAIYGQHLGPKTGCKGGSGWGDPKPVCGTSVTVSGEPAALLYVQEQQINVRVPYNVPTEGDVPFVVRREGRASTATLVHFSPYTAAITSSGTAYVGMPIWIEIQLPDPLGYSLRYPVASYPEDFGGHWFEVRQNGVLLRPIVHRQSPRISSGIGGLGSVGRGSLIGLPHEPKNRRRLPLHLAYRFDKPGSYEVRYVGYDFRYPTQKHVLVRSAWIPLEVEAFSALKRQAWLESMRGKRPADAVELLSDYLPSLLAVPDATVLSLLTNALYHSESSVRNYTCNALDLFDDALIASWIPRTVRANGPTPELAYVLSWRRPSFQARGGEIANSVLSYMKSTSPLLVAGALQSLYFMKPVYDWSSHPDLPVLMDRTVAGEAERLIETHNATILQPLALYLGTWKDERSRILLRRLVTEGTVREQAEICLRWMGADTPH